MATRTQIQTTIGHLVWALNEAEAYATSNSEKFAGSGGHEADFRGGLQTDYQYRAAMESAMERFRGKLASLLNSSTASELLAAPILEYGYIEGFPERTVQSILSRLYDDFQANSRTVESRDFGTPGTPSASGTGNGKLNRLTVDEHNFRIESMTAEAKTATCIQDEFTGSGLGEEVFEIRGAAPTRDSLVPEGSGRVGRLSGLTANQSTRYIQNPSFDIEHSGTGTDKISGWTISTGSASDVADETTTTYRSYTGAPRAASIAVSGNVVIRQDFSANRIKVRPDVPMYVQVAVNKGTMSAGTFTLRCGGVTSTATEAQLSAGWNIVRLGTALGTTGGSQANWYSAFQQSTPIISVETTSLTGTIYIDDVIFAPFQQFDSTWYALVGGSTPFLRDDAFTFSDSASETGLIQKWIARTFGRYLPHTTGTPTWTEPT